jgi:hypothetical protein
MNLKNQLARAAAAIAAMVMAMIRALFGGAKKAGAAIAGDVRMVARGVRDGASHVAHVAGRGLAGPLRALDLTASGIGGVLGAMIPRRPVGARAELQAAMMIGGAVQRSAEAHTAGDAKRAEFLDDDLPPHVAAWLRGLSPSDLRHIAGAHIGHVAAHVQGRSQMEGIPLVPPLSTQPSPAALDTRRLLAEIRARARTDRAEVAEMMKRGPRPAVLPTADDDEDYAPRWAGPRAAFG